MKNKCFSRINVVGSSGSGKSTFSKKLAELTGYKYIEMDQIFWGPDWHWPPDEEFFENLKDAISCENWILDGNYTRTIPIKWQNVDVVIWIDYSFSRTMLQAVKRAISRSVTQEELWPGTGNRESFKKSFLSKESIILWSLQNYSKVKEKYLAYMEDESYAHIQFVRLRSPRESRRFLESLR